MKKQCNLIKQILITICAIPLVVFTFVGSIFMFVSVWTVGSPYFYKCLMISFIGILSCCSLLYLPIFQPLRDLFNDVIEIDKEGKFHIEIKNHRIHYSAGWKKDGEL